MRKKGKKLLLLFLALTLVFSTATLTAMAKKASAETSVSTASEDKAPDPVFMSDHWALQGASRSCSSSTDNSAAGARSL